METRLNSVLVKMESPNGSVYYDSAAYNKLKTLERLRGQFGPKATTMVLRRLEGIVGDLLVMDVPQSYPTDEFLLLSAIDAAGTCFAILLSPKPMSPVFFDALQHVSRLFYPVHWFIFYVIPGSIPDDSRISGSVPSLFCQPRNLEHRFSFPDQIPLARREFSTLIRELVPSARVVLDNLNDIIAPILSEHKDEYEHHHLLN